MNSSIHATRKFLIVMKLTVFLITVLSLQASAEAFSQKISISFKKAPLEKVMKEISRQSGYDFLFDAGYLKQARRVTVEMEQAGVEQVLQRVFISQPFTYKIDGRAIIVLPKAVPAEPPRPAMQQNTVRGIVTDTTGAPLPGVTVAEKGTGNATGTYTDGRYTIEVAEGATLVFSSIGFVTREIAVGTQTVIDVSLSQDVLLLGEVVAIGYGTVKKRDVTGAVSSVKAEDFNRGIATAPEQLMQGKVAGVNIVASSGQPGAPSTVRIRGTSSISAGNDPLYVVDGIPLQFNAANLYVNVTGESTSSPFSSEGSNPLNVLNPSDIESIEILKDASATAIYGSRGANGVILITTKGKKAAGETVSYDAYVGVSSIRKTLPFMNAAEYRDYAQSNDLPYPEQNANTYWQDEVFRTTLSHNHNLSFGGGSENTSYRASMGYTNQAGIILSSALEKYTGRLNANHHALDGKLNIGLNVNYAKLNNDNTPVSSNIRNEGGNILKDALRWAPTLPVRNEDGSFYQIGELRVNPVSWADLTDESSTDNFIGSVAFTYHILNPLSVSVNLGYTDEAIERFTYVPASHPLGESEKGRGSISKLKNYSTTMETTLNFTKDFTENSNLNVLAGYSFYRYVTQNTFTLANQFVSDASRWNLIQSGNMLSNTSYKSANRLASVYGRINLKLKDRYLFTTTLRNDGSSRFGENNRWGFFPSGAFAWNISGEPFFNVPAISDLKLRLGYGVTGNQEIPDNLYREQLTVDGSSIYVLGGEAIPSVLPSNYANPDLKWEQTSQLNVGLDWVLLDGRLTGSFDVYRKKTSDLLLEFSTVAPSVVNNQWANVGEVENKGFEFTLDGVILNKKDLQWKANLNFSRNVNEVISLSNEQLSRNEITLGPSSGVIAEGASTQIIRPGLPLGSFWGRKYLGLDENGMETYLDEDGVEGPDRIVIGDANPDFAFGFSNALFWKQFDLSVTLRGVVGNDVFNNTAAEFSYTNSTPGVNVLRNALARGVSRDQTAQYSSAWIEDGSYLRLDNMSIGYTLPGHRIPFLSRARLYVTGQNLFVISGYTGFDPEVRTNTNEGNTPPIGIDYMAYPRPRVFMIGANLAF